MADIDEPEAPMDDSMVEGTLAKPLGEEEEEEKKDTH